jgi:hypothetical protein
LKEMRLPGRYLQVNAPETPIPEFGNFVNHGYTWKRLIFPLESGAFWGHSIDVNLLSRARSLLAWVLALALLCPPQVAAQLKVAPKARTANTRVSPLALQSNIAPLNLNTATQLQLSVLPTLSNPAAPTLTPVHHGAALPVALPAAQNPEVLTLPRSDAVLRNPALRQETEKARGEQTRPAETVLGGLEQFSEQTGIGPGDHKVSANIAQDLDTLFTGGQRGGEAALVPQASGSRGHRRNKLAPALTEQSPTRSPRIAASFSNGGQLNSFALPAVFLGLGLPQLAVLSLVAMTVGVVAWRSRARWWRVLSGQARRERLAAEQARAERQAREQYLADQPMTEARQEYDAILKLSGTEYTERMGKLLGLSPDVEPFFGGVMKVVAGGYNAPPAEITFEEAMQRMSRVLYKYPLLIDAIAGRGLALWHGGGSQLFADLEGNRDGLVPSGELLRSGKAPFAGELTIGVDKGGANDKNLSTTPATALDDGSHSPRAYAWRAGRMAWSPEIGRATIERKEAWLKENYMRTIDARRARKTIEIEREKLRRWDALKLAANEGQFITAPFPVLYAMHAGRHLRGRVSAPHKGLAGEIGLYRGAAWDEIRTIFVPADQVTRVRAEFALASGRNPALADVEIVDMDRAFFTVGDDRFR